MMPLLAGSLNFAWELNALLLSGGMWGHVLWFGLDVFIVILNIASMKRGRFLYLIVIAALSVILRWIFTIPSLDGMLLSVFAIDLLMACDYVVNAKKISKHGKIPIAITKFWGDFFAWLAYSEYMYVNIIGAVVFLLNLYYLAVCLDASRDERCRRPKGGHK